MSTPAFLDASATAVRFGVSVSRISEWYRDRATTGFPEAADNGSRIREWALADLEAWFTRRAGAGSGVQLGDEDPDELLGAPQVAALLGVKSIHSYLAKPGYFPEPDVTEDAGRYLRRFWRRATIVNWDATRPGKGNTQPKAKRPAPAAPVQPTAELAETVDSAEAARLLGYASTASFASAYAQGNLPELGEPAGVQETSGRGRASRSWATQGVLAAAARRRRDQELVQRRQEVCVKALEAANGAPVSAKDLFAADPEAGTLQQWKATLDAMRRQLKT